MMSSIWGFAVKSGTLNSLLLILSFILSTTQSKPVINPTLQSIDWSRVAAVTVLGSFTSISFSASAHPLPSPPHLLPTGSNTHLSIIDADNQIVYPVTISYDSIPHACAVANQIFALVLLNSAADIYVLDIYTGTAQKVWTQVNSFECDSNGAVDEGALWIATESGLTRWNPESKNVAKFNEIGAVYSLAINSGSVFASGTWNAPPPPIFETAFTLRGVGSNDQLNSCDHVLPAFPTGFSVSMYKPTKITAIRIAHSGDRADIK